MGNQSDLKRRVRFSLLKLSSLFADTYVISAVVAKNKAGWQMRFFEAIGVYRAGLAFFFLKKPANLSCKRMAASKKKQKKV
ncbi:MAG: hypothetical protein ACYSRR_00560 [Planctomycetota bacterium]|jgi:hypothetical protein